MAGQPVISNLLARINLRACYRPVVLNAVLFQLAWLGFVAGAGINAAWLGIPPLLGLLLLAASQPYWRQDLLWLISAAMVGTWLELFWITHGVLDYGMPSTPWWIIALWISLALTFNHSLAWLSRYPWLAAGLAATAVPFSYTAGASLDAVTISGPLTYISLAWALLFYLVFSLQRSRHFQLNEVEI